MWNVKKGRCKVISEKGHAKKITALAISPDETMILTGSLDESVILWDARTGKQLKAIPIEAGFYPTVVGFTSDRSAFFAGLSDGRILLWSTANKEFLATLDKHKSIISSLAFSPDGKTIATGSSDETVCIWDMDNGRLLKEFKGYAGPITTIAYALNGKFLLAGSWHTVLVWNTETGELIRELKGHTDKISALVNSPDGKTLVTASIDGKVLIWDATCFAVDVSSSCQGGLGAI